MFRYTESYRYTRLFSFFDYCTREAKTTAERFLCVAFRDFGHPSAVGFTDRAKHFRARPGSAGSGDQHPRTANALCD